MASLYKAILHFLQANQFLSTGALLMVLGSVLALMRNAPKRILQWAEHRFMMEVEVHSQHYELFEWLSIWLDRQPYSRRARRLTAHLTYRGPVPRLIFSPAPGHHIFTHRRRLIWLERVRKESDKPTRDTPVEEFHLRILSRNQEAMRAIFEDAKACAAELSRVGVRVFVSSGPSWISNGQELIPRLLESVILPFGQIEMLIDDVRNFRQSGEWYRKMGVPWRRGYLLYGVPGTGKTSFIGALAGEMNLDLYLLNIGSPSLNDEKLIGLMQDIRSDAIVLLEDIDAAFDGRKATLDARDEAKGITFSGLLNALDGVAAREGCLIFMTTNKRDVLDPALIRPGRADVHLEFTHATEEQASRLFERFFPESPAEAAVFAERLLLSDRSFTMAELQQHLLKYRHSSPREAVNAFAPIAWRPSSMQEAVPAQAVALRQ